VKFRVLCFNRKAEFEAGNHAAKRRIATEIVDATKALNGRFLKKKQDKGPWFEQSFERAILKACQVMRDFQRPDRVALREMAAAGGARKRQRSYESTPGVILVSLQDRDFFSFRPSGSFGSILGLSLSSLILV
jgi:uncharacterized protein (UPF0303 family)